MAPHQQQQQRTAKRQETTVLMVIFEEMGYILVGLDWIVFLLLLLLRETCILPNRDGKWIVSLFSSIIKI